MGFQPYTDPDYAYATGVADLGGNLGDATGLVETAPGSRLAVYNVGDFAYPSLVPVPHVELTLFSMAADTVTITVYRTVKSRTLPVRGQINVYAVGGRNVVDWDAPFGVPITYRAEQFDEDGNSLGYTATFATQLDVDETWIGNPFDPAHGIPVKLAGDALGTLSRPIPTNTYWPEGSGTAVAIATQRRGLTDVPLPFLTFTEDDGDAIRDMFGDPYTGPSIPPIVVIRTGAKTKTMRLPQPFYAVIDNPEEQGLDAQTGGTLIRWDCTATEVAQPAPGLVNTVLSYADLDAAFPSYGQRDAAFDSYLAQDRAYEYAGLAEE